ncbi:uncharacterized protein LOC134530265 [Bacillus rossius redtenbacheri]|uniref:uncharacterized protein LOC134530265 n=1 Tax=Bacillus rossius redtenbacheri TaxID=93214 RepID=UPI002FDEA63D
MQLFLARFTPLLLLLAAASAFGLEGYKCKLDDSACLKNYLQNDVIGRFSKGLPEFGVKSFDPLSFKQLTFNYEAGPAIKATLDHIDATLYGLSKTKVLDVRTELSGPNFKIEASVSIPKLFYEGLYTCKGEWLLIPVDWSGKFNMSLGYITDTWKLSAVLMQRGDDAYLQLEDVSFSPKVTNFNTYASGLFWGNEEAGNFALAMTNRYWSGFYDVMWKLAEPDVLKTISDAVRSVFSKTPISGLASVAASPLPAPSFD